jgi:hypothetical protein
MNGPSNLLTFAILAGCVLSCRQYDCPLSEPNTQPCDNLLVNGVVLTPNVATIQVGQTLHITATLTSSNAAVSPSSLRWSSADSTKASVDSAGVVTGRAPTVGVSICALATNVGLAASTGCAQVIVDANPRGPGNP